MPIEALQREWRSLYGAEPPTRMSRDLLVRAIAFKLQERAHGGMSASASRRLRSLMAEFGGQRRAPFDMSASLKPGARLVREWRGRTHSVLIREDGFEYEGERHRSLTGIARLITGSHWSGPVFFGLRNRAQRKQEGEEPGHG